MDGIARHLLLLSDAVVCLVGLGPFQPYESIAWQGKADNNRTLQ